MVDDGEEDNGTRSLFTLFTNKLIQTNSLWVLHSIEKLLFWFTASRIPLPAGQLKDSGNWNPKT